LAANCAATTPDASPASRYMRVRSGVTDDAVGSAIDCKILTLEDGEPEAQERSLSSATKS
jgi:hypothetical protein